MKNIAKNALGLATLLVLAAQPAAAQTAAWLSEMETLICGRLASAM